MKGKTLLMVTGILLIVFGSGALIFTIAMPAIGFLKISMDTYTLIAAALTMIHGILEIVAGILGIIYCKKPQKANVCIVFGALVILFRLADILLPVIRAGSTNLMIMGVRFPFAIVVILSLTVPVLYFIGAMLKKNSLRKDRMQSLGTEA